MTTSPLEESYLAAIRQSFTVRDAQAARQAATGTMDAGTRGSVTGGAHMDAIATVLEEIFIENGIHRSAIKRTGSVEIPGYYRPTKKWDLVVAGEGFLIAAIELKSQFGSFGNNFNNRTEEAIGSAVDVRRAYQAGTLGHVSPWLGYYFLLEDSPKSASPVKVAKSTPPAEAVFTDLSYAGRYQMLLRRLTEDGLYDAACFATSARDDSAQISHPDPNLSFTAFRTAIARRVTRLREDGLLY